MTTKEYVTPEFVRNLIEDPGMMGPAIIELARKYLELLSQDDWIKSCDQTPPDGEVVLVSNGIWVGLGSYHHDEHLLDDERWQDEQFEFIDMMSKYPVTHWKPKPGLPKPEIQNDQNL